MLSCSRCGTKVSSTDKFCPFCREGFEDNIEGEIKKVVEHHEETKTYHDNDFNVGEKIKTAATLEAIVLGIISLIAGSWVLSEVLVLGIVIIIGGIVAAYYVHLFMYGFGELISTNVQIAQSNKAIAKKLNKIAKELEKK